MNQANIDEIKKLVFEELKIRYEKKLIYLNRDNRIQINLSAIMEEINEEKNINVIYSLDMKSLDDYQWLIDMMNESYKNEKYKYKVDTFLVGGENDGENEDFFIITK